MKDEWYADNRDLVKWGGIVHLCNTTGIKRVVQVAYYRESKWLKLSFNNKKVDIPEEVSNHFRNIKDIHRLGRNVGINIDILMDNLTNYRREDYTQLVCEHIERQNQRQIVFLDPDTGLASRKAKAKAEHVTCEEITSMWHQLKRGDYLVLYQHSFRDTNWRDIRRRELAQACNISPSMVQKWEASDKTKDVVFLFCEK